MRSIILLASLVDLIAGQKCAPVHMIVARGSGEARGEGVTSKLSTAVKGALPGTTSEALDYPAKMPYNGSMAVGSVNLKKVITNYTAACPSSKIVLAGYSQGGSVTLDALCGGGGHPEIGPITKGMTKEEGRNIKAVVAFGEPRFVAGMSYGAGTEAQKSGVRLFALARSCARWMLSANGCLHRSCMPVPKKTPSVPSLRRLLDHGVMLETYDVRVAIRGPSMGSICRNICRIL